MIQPGPLGKAEVICDRCGRQAAPDRRPWSRVRPDFARLQVCRPCEVELLRRAEDQGSTAADHLHVLHVGLVLGGEIWRVGDTLWWFRESLGLPKATPSNAPLVPAARPRPFPWWRRLLRSLRPRKSQKVLRTGIGNL